MCKFTTQINISLFAYLYKFFTMLSYMDNPYENPPWVKKIIALLDHKGEVELNSKPIEDKVSLSKSLQKRKENSELKEEKIKIVLTPKEEGLLWTEMLKELRSLKKRNRDIIPFPDVYEKLCRKFSMRKAKVMNCLLFLAEFGFIKFVCCKGIKLNYEVSIADIP